MDYNNNLKKIFKYYLSSKKKYDNKKDFFLYLEKIIIYLDRLDKKNKEYQNHEIILNKIKEFSIDNINNYIDNHLLIKKKEYIDHDIFNHIINGNIEKICLTSSSYSNKIYNEDGQTPLHVCIDNGDTNMLKELLKKGEKIDTVNKYGNTLLEYACIHQDPTFINFLVINGANIQKHLFFRDDNKNIKIYNDDIDLSNIIKICINNESQEDDNLEIDFLYNYISPKEKIGICNITFDEFYKYLKNTVNNMSKESQECLIDIWKEELNYKLENKLGCPDNNIEILLINLIPFINYPFYISNFNILSNEIIFLIKNNLKNNNFILDLNFNKRLINKLWSNYSDIYSYDFIGNIIFYIFSKVKNI